VSNDNVVQEHEQQQVSENLNEVDEPSSQPENSIDDEQEASIHRSLLNMLE
jgi:hypothetical protein